MKYYSIVLLSIVFIISGFAQTTKYIKGKVVYEEQSNVEEPRLG